MRLNFSGAGEDEIREGVRRIGEVVREQVALYGTLTGTAKALPRTSAQPSRRSAPPEAADPDLAKILRLPEQRTRAG